MRINWSKIILTLVLILIGGLFYSTNSINAKRNINDIIIDFESTNKLFITKDSILNLLPTNFSDKKSIDINAIESLVNSNGFIKNSEAYISIDGDLIIAVQQRNPIGRIISDNTSFYIDDESKIMTTSKIYSSNVPVIFNYSESISYDRIYEICDLVYNDDFLRKNISRVNFINKNYITLNFRGYEFDIELGENKNIDRKIKNFKAFYHRSINNETLNNYSKINLQFENQVVCSNK
ncbi:MAG: cell division protein FtsQ/DivIB [Flavobacteriaceae bacterium]|tara:strand:+ start:1387 stop:2094 length:708 start_codon:yes stop_codon:yes gene_type:complete